METLKALLFGLFLTAVAMSVMAYTAEVYAPQRLHESSSMSLLNP